jgi:predicted ATP-grasp superfamily ATP-dependent carboligase
MNYPVIIKLPRGTQGKGVMFAESFASASSTLDALDSMNKVYLLQEYIETGGKDLRVLVVGNQIVGTMQREAQKDEKRANIHAGGCGVSKRITPEIEDICLKTAKILGTEVVGIDILEGRKPYVIEANLSPGLQGITAVTKINIAQKIAKYLYEKGCSFKEKYTNESVSNMIDEISLNKHIENVIVSNLTMRGKKIILPDFVTNITKFNDSKEVTFKIAKGKVEITEK